MQDIRFDGKLNCIIDNVGFISVSRNKNFTFEYKKGKGKYSFRFVKRGRLEYFFADTGKSVKIESGDVLYMPKHLPYKARYLDDNTVIKIILFDVVSDHVPSVLESSYIQKSISFSSVFDSVTSENLNNTMFLSSKVYELIYLMKKDNLKIEKKYKKIIPAVNEIKQFYYENKKLSYYADMCYMSESNFRKLFKEYTGKSPVEYRNIIRILEAKKMVDSGEFTVTEAAYRTGFNNMSFFYEVYNKTLGK